MYKPKFFILEELVPPDVFTLQGDKAWLSLDDRLLLALDALRYEFGPIIINTWHNPKLWFKFGKRSQSGLRTESFYKDNLEFKNSASQHKYGRAADMLFVDSIVDRVRDTILNEPDRFPVIHGVELDVPWLHVDCGNRRHITTF